MGGTKMHALVGLTALAACVLMMNVGTGAQATIEAPGARRPLAPSKPRITPLPQAEWTEVQRGLAAKYWRQWPGGQRAANAPALPRSGRRRHAVHELSVR